VKTHNSSRIIFSGRTLAIKTVTVYTVKSNANHTLFGNAIHSFSSVVIASSTLAINIGLLISPTMGKKKFNELLGAYVAKPPGKLALVPESDPREPVDLTSAPDQEFSVLPDEE